MGHEKILVAAIHPNPHRDFKQNPLNEDQVQKIFDSIGRTKFWENTVVRRYPDLPGEYQLAHGHNRLEAVRRAGIKEVTLPVMDLNDFEMYVQMVDENETQLTITPAIAFENIKAGVALLEKVFTTIGPKGTEEQFFEELNRGSQSRDEQRCSSRHHTGEDAKTRTKDGHGFEQVRADFFRGGGIGRVFIAKVFPSSRVHGHVVIEVLNSLYGSQRAEVKRKEAEEEEVKHKEAEASQKQAEQQQAESEARRKESEARRKEAEVKEQEAKKKNDEAEVKRQKAEAEKEEKKRKQAEAAEERHRLEVERRRKEADEARIKAEKLRAEARKIGDGVIDEKILTRFGTPTQMTAFAQVVKSLKIPQTHHQAAMEYALKKDLSVRDTPEQLNLWWDEVSGERDRRYKRVAKQQAQERFEKSIRGGDFQSYLSDLSSKASKLKADARQLDRQIETALTAAPYYEDKKHCAGVCKTLGGVRDQLLETTKNINTLMIGLNPDARTRDIVIEPKQQQIEHSNGSK